MPNYTFIKISNNKNAARDFMIDITTMQKVNLRMGAIKSQYKKYLANPDKYTWREPYHYLAGDYSYYRIDRRYFNTYHEAKEHKLDLMDQQYLKMNPGETIATDSDSDA